MTYEKIADFKDKHKDEPAFILGSGPSLRGITPEDMSQFITFACNDAFLRAYWATYWVTGDPRVLNAFINIRSQTHGLLAHTIISGLPVSEGVVVVDRKNIPNPDQPKSHPLYPMSFDLEKDGYYEANTPSHFALQVASWMGCNPIFLYGVDFNRTEHLTHFYGSRTMFQKNDLDRYSLCVDAIHDAAAKMEQGGTRVFNCSRISALTGLRFLEIKDALMLAKNINEGKVVLSKIYQCS